MKNEARFLKAIKEEKKKAKKVLILCSSITITLFILSMISIKVENDTIFFGIIFGIMTVIFSISIIFLTAAIVWYKDTKYCFEALNQIINLLPIGKTIPVYLREDNFNIAGKVLYNICDNKQINITLLEDEKTNNVILLIEVEGYQNISNTIKYYEAREVEELEMFISLINWKKTKLRATE